MNDEGFMIQETTLKFFTNNINRKDAGIDVFIEIAMFYKHAGMESSFFNDFPKSSSFGSTKQSKFDIARKQIQISEKQDGKFA